MRAWQSARNLGSGAGVRTNSSLTRGGHPKAGAGVRRVGGGGREERRPEGGGAPEGGGGGRDEQQPKSGSASDALRVLKAPTPTSCHSDITADAPAPGSWPPAPDEAPGPKPR